ncbi:MAG: ATP-binding cassette domain-containing protein, partial [Clostridiales Family XIII bacterium]|nr:ATP-binding cassette domain-containing protein [Clostridiales Family XIII bacterium]
MANISITNLTFAWEGRAENVFEDVSFRFDTNRRIGLIGRNGRGKTTLLTLLA